MTQQSLLELDIGSYTYEGLRTFVDRIEFVLNSIPPGLQPSELTKYTWSMVVFSIEEGSNDAETHRQNQRFDTNVSCQVLGLALQQTEDHAVGLDVNAVQLAADSERLLVADKVDDHVPLFSETMQFEAPYSFGLPAVDAEQEGEPPVAEPVPPEVR